MATSEILLQDVNDQQPVQIIQLYKHLELYSAGEPAQHTLFVLGRSPGLLVSDQLLLIDPPADAAQRFKLEGDVAALFTGTPLSVGVPLVETQPGGVAHLRVGTHLLDLYTQPDGNVVHLPAVGVLVGGNFGSDVMLPTLPMGSDGEAQLDTLRLLARLVKERQLQLYIPRIGTLCQERTEILQRLAADVAYLHSLRRVVPALVERGDDEATIQSIAASLQPADRRSALATQTHQANVVALLGKSS